MQRLQKGHILLTAQQEKSERKAGNEKTLQILPQAHAA
jgi:hypothetical protein